ncbi:MAG: DUF2520 domain-containing protein [Gemmatimonadota bacterium]|nr:MAG: DUF2520 domain-containing protein [Gemmatimonadota bacterium]
MTRIGIIGAGRAGVGLAAALTEAGYEVLLHGRSPKEVPTKIEFSHGELPAWLTDVDVLVLAVRDDALEPLALELSQSGKLHAEQVVLHLSGVLDGGVLASLRSRGCRLGSMHPLQSLSDPETAAERLRGAAGAIEGDAEAVDRAEELANALGLKPLRISSDSKALYHAAAVFASNYIVVVSAAAHRLLERAGVSPEDARDALAPIIRGTVENIVRRGPEGALTGPIARGDIATIRKHLESLTSEETELYRALGHAALNLAQLSDDESKAVGRELGP